jgi:hypothetical protein
MPSSLKATSAGPHETVPKFNPLNLSSTALLRLALYAQERHNPSLRPFTDPSF